MSDNAFEPSEYDELAPKKTSGLAMVAGGVAIALGVLSLPCSCLGIAGGIAGSTADMSLVIPPEARDAFMVYTEAMAPYQLVSLVLTIIGLFVSVIEIIAGVLALTGRTKPLAIVAVGVMIWHVLVTGLWPILVQLLNWTALQEYLTALSQSSPSNAGAAVGVYVGLGVGAAIAGALTLLWGAIAGAAFHG